MKQQSGFSLIELMMTVATLVIITTIAVPSYQQHVKRSQRADATSALLLIAAEQEKFYIQNNAYTLNLDDLNIDGTTEGYYSLTLSTDTNVAQNFTATATAVQGGPQGHDSDCKIFTLDSTGERTASGTPGDTTEICW